MRNISQTTSKFLFIAICIFISLNRATAQYVEFTQITDDLPAQEHPAIYGDYVVFESEVTVNNHDLLLYQISTGQTTTIVTDPSSAATYPDIYEDMVVWQDNRGGDWEIYYYVIGASNPEGGQPLLVWEGDQTEPAIYGDNIVFADKKPGNTTWNIQWLQNTPGILQRLTDDTDGDQRRPDIYEHRIVWQDMRMGNWDIYMYDFGHDEYVVITEDPEAQRYPSIGEGRIVWEDWREGDANIYMHLTFPTIYHAWDNYDWPVNLSDVHPYQSSYNQTRPKIHGDNLVFMDYRNGNQDIYMYRFYSELWGDLYRITEETADQRFPAVFDKYVVWQDERITDGQDPYKADIWMWEFPPGADMLVVIQDEPDPVETYSDLTYSIFVWNSGPQDAVNAILTANLPDNIDYVSGRIINGDVCSRSGDVVTCDFGDKPAGTLDTVEIVVRPNREGIISLTAEVQSDEDDLWPSNNIKTAKTDVVWQMYEKIGRGASPSFKLDGNNKIHVVYLSDSWEGDLIYATNALGGWINTTLDEDAGGCMLDIDALGDIHIVYSKMGNSGEYALIYRVKTNDGWQPEEELASNFMGFYNLDICISPTNIIYISYLKSQWNDPIQLAYKKDGTWHGPNSLGVYAYNDQAMEVDENGHLHFAFYMIAGNPPGPQYYTNAPDSVWKTQVAIEPNWAGSQLETLNLDLALDSNGNPHMSYSGGHNGDWQENHKYARLSGGNWNYEFIEEEGYSVFNTVATDANQKAHLLYRDMEGNRLRYADNKSGSWDRRTIDYETEDICDIEVDDLDYRHIIYSSNLNLRYVTDAPEAPKPKMDLSPDVIDFVFRNVGDTTDARKAVIKNTGDADLLITDVKLVWRDSLSFSISNNTCDVVNPGDTCSIDVKFNPTIIGNKTALLWVECNDPDDNIQSVRLEGLGLQPIINDYGNQAFGDVLLGDSAVSVYTIKNQGNTNLHIQGVYIEQDDAEDFYYTDLPAVPFNIGEEDSIQFKLIFKPTSHGEKTTKLKIFTSDLDLTRILTGMCVEPLYTVSGSVEIDENTAVSEGLIILNEITEEGVQGLWRYKPLEGATTFEFINVQTQWYTLRFDPDPDAYPGYLKTYLGNTPFFHEATKFMLDNDTSDLVIQLVPVPPPPEGNGEVSGNMVDEEDSGGGRIENGRYAGDGTPVEDATAYLLDADGNIVDYDYTDEAGGFDFQNIPNGNYQFYADYKGYPMDPANEDIVLKDGDQDIEIAVIVDNQKISARVMSISGLLTFKDGGFKAYPIPATNQLTVEVPRSFDAKVMRISFINTLGKKTMIAPSAIRYSQRQLELDGVVQSLSNGIYMLVIETEEEGYFTKIIKYSY